jgi:tricorn protease
LALSLVSGYRSISDPIRIDFRFTGEFMNLMRRSAHWAAFVLASLALTSAGSLFATAAPADSAAPAPAAGSAQAPLLLQSPSLSQTTIAFRYADDIWTVPRGGGAAERLTSTGVVREGPYFSPDGTEIAYSARLHGGLDVYVVPATGGIPRRITWHPMGNSVIGWSRDGKDVLFASMMASPRHYMRIFRAHADGSGMPEALPLPAAYEGSYSPDGGSFAYEPTTRWQAAWKQYHGGQNVPIWIVNLKTLDLEKIPSDNTTDSDPVWIGDQVYFLSNRSVAGPSPVEKIGMEKYGPVSLYRYDTKSKAVTLAVPNKGLDLKTMQAGPGGLVYEQFGSLHLVDLNASGQPGEDHTVQISIHGDLPKLAPHLATITPDEIQNVELSPTGQRVAIEAHGDIFTVPAEKGDTRNLTNTSGSAERSPAWSPDGKTIAYFSDASGEYQLYLREQTGFKAPTVIDLGPNPSFFYNLHWSPDSKKILYTDKHLHLWYVDAPGTDDKGKETPAGKPVLVETSHAGGFGGDGFGAAWSPDSKWIGYTRELENNLKAVFLYSLETKKATQVTDGMSDASSAAFDPNGKFLYFLASTDDGPSTAGIDLSSIDRAESSAAYVIVLSKDGASPIPPESDDEKVKEEEKKKDDKNPVPPPKAGFDDKSKKDDKADAKADADKKDGDKKEDKTDDKKVEVKIDLDGIGNRILSLPVPARNYGGLVAGKTGVIYLEEGSPVGRSSSEGGGSPIRALWRFTTDKRKTEQLLSDIDGFVVSADGSKALVSAHNSLSIIATDDLKPSGDSGKGVNLGNMHADIDLREEWKQIFNETWRIERDFLYDPNTHGVSIPKIKARYAPYLDGLASRNEFSYLSVEMLGEINIGHMFISGPYVPDNSPKTGLLGADYTIDHDRYKISKILGGQNWTPGLASPLTLPGVYVHEGAYLLAVNGKEIHATDNLYSFFEGTAGMQTVLHIAYNPEGKDAKDVTVVPVGDEDGLRNIDWIENNLREVDKLSGGKVAYVYMPNTGGSGYTNFNRYFYSQLDKKALVLDERWNEGGLIADYIVDTLKRQPLSIAVERDSGKAQVDPVGAIFGPKTMLINQNSGSGGDAMPWYFKKAGIGKLVGTRTWGGLVGIGGFPTLLDGGSVTAPRYAIFGLTGDYEVENHGIAPDETVDMTPKDFMAGKDLQLETGVKLVLDELKTNPVPAIPVPKYFNYHEHDAIGKN